MLTSGAKRLYTSEETKERQNALESLETGS